MFSLKSKPKPSLRVDTTDAPARPKGNTAKAYLIGMAASSQKLIKKQTHPTRPAPTTPEEQIISLPAAAPQSVPGLTPDKGLSTPPSSLKKRTENAMGYNYRHIDGSPTPLNDNLSSQTRSTSSNESDTECVFCSVGLTFAQETEPVHKLKCGHYSHDRCLYRLNGSVKEAGDFDVLCSVCECPVAPASTTKEDAFDEAFASAAEFAPGFRPGISTPVSNGFAGGMSRSSSLGILTRSESSLRPSTRQSHSNLTLSLSSTASLRPHSRDGLIPSLLQSPMLAPDELGSPVSPLAIAGLNDSDSTSVSTGRATLSSNHGMQHSDASKASASQSSHSGTVVPPSPTSSASADSPTSSLGLSARQEVNSLLASEHAITVECSPRMRPFRVLTAAEPGKGTTRVLVTVQAEAAAAEQDILSGYRFTAKDIQHSIKASQYLAQLKFEYKAMAIADMTTLRLHTMASVTSPDSRTLDWKDCEVYLFDDLIIIMRDSTVSAAMALKQSKVQVYVERSRPSIVELRFANSDMIDLNLDVASSVVAHMWKHAFENPSANFPLAPGENYDNYVARLQKHLDNANTSVPDLFLPAEIVICLPVNSSSQLLVMQQAVRAAIRSLSYRDRLGAVIFSRRGIERKVELTAPHSTVWETALDNIDLLGKSAAATCTLDLVLSAAQQLLAKREALEATASIVLASDSDVQLRSFPPHLARGRVPVQTIGLCEAHNALALSTLAQVSAGSYHFAKSNDEFYDLISALLRLETRYAHKNVTLRFKPRISTSIVGVLGGNTAPSIEPDSTCSDILSPKDRTRMIDGETALLEWSLGAMRMGDIRSVVVEVRGDIPAGANILQVSLEATHALSPDDTACISVFRVPIPAMDESVDERVRSLLLVFSSTQAVLKELELAMVFMVQGESRAAYDRLLAGLQSLQSMQRWGLVKSKPMLSLLEASQWLFDTCCDDIVKNSHRTQGFMLDLLQRLWIFYSQLSLLKRDPIECAFHEHGANHQ